MSVCCWFAYPVTSAPASDLAVGQRPLQLGVFGARGPQQMGHRDRPVLVGGEEGGAERDVADVAAGDVEPRQRCRRSIRPSASSAGRRAARSRRARATSGNGNCTTKRMRRRKAGSSACFMLVVRIARPAIGLHPLQQIADLDIGVAVVAVLDLAALAEQARRPRRTAARRRRSRRRRTRGAGSSRSRRCTC